MSKIDDRIAEIKTQLIGVTKLKVLMVEGVDDVDAISILLSRRFPSWEKTWRVVAAGNKRQVLQLIQQETTWLGLVDRDEWTADETAHFAAENPGLLVLPRFCLESYLIDPAELWEAFPMKQRDKLTGGYPQLQTKILDYKATWLRHAALWHVINPLWRHLIAKGFTGGALDSQAIPDDVKLLAMLKDWHATIDAEATLTKVHRLQAELQALPDTQLFSSWLYAKDFYPQVVHQVLNELLGQKSVKERRAALFRTVQIPSDLDPLWRRMGLV